MIIRLTGARIWLLSSAGAIAAASAVLVLFRSPQRVGPGSAVPTSGSAVAVGLARLGGSDEDTLLKEEATMRDPTPLFLPTRWNAGEAALPIDIRRELGTSFAGYPPKIVYGETELKLNLPPAVVVPASSAEAFATDRPLRPFAGLGQRDEPIAPLAARVAFVKVSSTADGESVLAEPLDQAAPPNESAWQPLEFLVAVDRTGVVGPAILTESSRVPTVDSYFGEYLVNGLHIGERLAPGFYRVAIGP